MGAMEHEDDINFDENTGEVIFKVRALKGRLLATPILKRLKPVTQPEKGPPGEGRTPETPQAPLL